VRLLLRLTNDGLGHRGALPFLKSPSCARDGWVVLCMGWERGSERRLVVGRRAAPSAAGLAAPAGRATAGPRVVVRGGLATRGLAGRLLAAGGGAGAGGLVAPAALAALASLTGGLTAGLAAALPATAALTTLALGLGDLGGGVAQRRADL